MADISGFGTVVTIIASNTFPAGFQVTQFSNDADPLDFSAVNIAELVVGLNGDPITWSKAMPLPAVLNVIPGSDDDANLSALADANRVSQGKNSAQDAITMTIVYPDGKQVTLSRGKIVSAQFGRGYASEGRAKTKAYGFSFVTKDGNV